MLSVQEAIDLICGQVKPLVPRRAELLEAAGCVLAEDVVADIDIPQTPNSAMDGYALRAQDSAGASRERPVRLRVVEELAAESVREAPLPAGSAVRIMTGANIPPGCDGVIPVEETRQEGEEVFLHKPVAPGSCIRPAGEDVRRGQTVMSAGALLRPGHVGMLASLGRSSVLVYGPARVAVLATGNEIIPVEEPLVAGRVRNSNTYTMAAMVKKYGAVPLVLGIGRDSMEVLMGKLREGEAADALVTSGGVSMGNYDLVQEAFKRVGVEVKFWKVAMQPGKPLVFGMLGEKPVFGLPGNPVSAMVCFEEFVRPALMTLMGRKDRFLPEATAVAEEDFKQSPQRLQFVRGVVSRDEKGYRVRSTGAQGSHLQHSMVRANAFVVVPSGEGRVRRGETVRVQFLETCFPD